MTAISTFHIVPQTSLETQLAGWKLAKDHYDTKKEPKKKGKLTEAEKAERAAELAAALAERKKKLAALATQLIKQGFADAKALTASVRVILKKENGAQETSRLYFNGISAAVSGVVDEMAIRKMLDVLKAQGGTRLVLANPDKFSETTKILAWKLAQDRDIELTNYAPSVAVQGAYFKARVASLQQTRMRIHNEYMDDRERSRPVKEVPMRVLNAPRVGTSSLDTALPG